MDKKLIERIALEVADALDEGDTEACIEFATLFLARIDAERGKEAVAWRAETGYEQPEYLYFEREPIRMKGVPLYLSPTIPEGMALVKIEITDKGVEASGAECQSGKCAYDVAAELWAEMLAAQGEQKC